jgi:UDP-glucuronate 4-epimerase
VSRNWLVTGAAGFIGYHVAEALLARGETVLGIDNVNDYYDPALKLARLARLRDRAGFSFQQVDIADDGALSAALGSETFHAVIHLAAQAGVRYSFENPRAYVDSNITGFLNLLEHARSKPPAHFVYASSSSVYGANTAQPFSIADRVDHPVSLYAATKRANELMAEVYARQFGLALTGLRFFTVYGPWGRPDMAAMKFARAMLAGEPIDVYNHGDLKRDFTYIDDIVDGVLRVADRVPQGAGSVRHRLLNIGNHRPEPLMRFIEVLSAAFGITPKLRMLPMQPGDVYETYADTSELEAEYGWKAHTSIDVGLLRMADWYRDYYGPTTR